MKTRSTNGRFVSPSKLNEESLIDTFLNIQVTKGSLLKVAKILVLILIISPWLVLAFRKQNIDNLSKKISDFYDDNFSYNSICNFSTNGTSILKEDVKKKIDF